jgi:thermitase
MKKAIVVLAAVMLLASSFPAFALAAPAGDPSPFSGFSPDQILVKFNPDVTLPEAAQIHRQLGGQVKETIAEIGVQVVSVPKGQAKEKAKAYGSNSRVAYAERDFVAETAGAPDDQYLDLQWALTKVDASQAWDVTTGSPGITIAVLDTGVDLDHPDLAGKIISNTNFSNSPTVDDVYGHGTHVAGIAAAMTDNSIGVAGLGYSASIMNVKVLSDMGAGSYSWITAGIIWAANNGADVINMSLGGPSTSSALEDAIDYAWSKGVVIVAAAGNNGDTTPMYPAYYSNCIAVAATDANDAKASWSNYGNWVDVAAPGVSIYSTLMENGYGYMSGTSMASPHVAGLAALVLTTVSDTDGDGKLNDEVRNQIEITCDDINVAGIGSGRVNAYEAVGGDTVPPSPAPPMTGSINGRVTDAMDSSAIPGAQVTDGTRTALTDASGIYTIDDIPPGNYQVVASKEGYETSSLTVNVVSGATATADFSLSELILPGSVTGLVIDVDDGLPIVGAAVSDGTRTTTTDASGEYIIAGVPAGSYEVIASKSGYESSSLTVDVMSDTVAEVNFSLSELILPGSITGSVTDAVDGSPISGAVVTDGARTATTDTSGEYTIANVPAGSYEVTAGKEGYESLVSGVTVTSGSTSVKDFSLRQNSPAVDTMWVNSIGFVQNGKNLFIEISVMTTGGPLAGADVGLNLQCSGGESWDFNGTSNTAGLVRFKLGKAPAGSYSAVITSLACSGFTWDPGKGVTTASYALGG